jgi:hypothetical protein
MRKLELCILCPFSHSILLSTCILCFCFKLCAYSATRSPSDTLSKRHNSLRFSAVCIYVLPNQALKGLISRRIKTEKCRLDQLFCCSSLSIRSAISSRFSFKLISAGLNLLKITVSRELRSSVIT